MPLLKMDHTTLIVRDLAKSHWFYGEVLGLKEVPRPSSFTFGGLWFQGPGFQVHLIDARETSSPVGFGVPREWARVGRGHHIAFEVDDLDAWLAHLRQYDIAIVGDKQPRGDGVIQSFVEDPDGHLLEFFVRP